jgi:hypothetical protein
MIYRYGPHRPDLERHPGPYGNYWSSTVNGSDSSYFHGSSARMSTINQYREDDDEKAFFGNKSNNSGQTMFLQGNMMK